jgi:6-phospho-beta-glucosidase
MVIKVTVLGGSSVATPELVEAIRTIPGRKQAIQLVLHGRSIEKLKTVATITNYCAEGDPLLEVDATTDLEQALKGAHFVLNQVRVGGLEARVFDETFPNDLGIPGEETVGPGGFANASRTIPVVLQYARKIEAICPRAMVITFVNPSSLVQYALTRYTRLKVIGLCDAPVSLKRSIANALALPFEEIEIGYVGMHHFGWVNSVLYRGEEKLAITLEKCSQISPDVDPDLVKALGIIPGHYLNYIFHPERMLAKKIGKPSRAEELIKLQSEILSEFTTSVSKKESLAALKKRNARWYQAIIAPVLIALIETTYGDDQGAYPFILNIVNDETLDWMPKDAIIEVPCQIHGGQISSLQSRPLPYDVTNLLQTNCAYERLAVEAIVEHDQEKALRALLRNPMVHSYDQAKIILNRTWNPIPGDET